MINILFHGILSKVGDDMDNQDLHEELLRSGEKRLFLNYGAKIDAKYAAATNTKYHAHRLDVLGSVLDGCDRIIPGARVIDFGCGDGLFGKIMAKKGAIVTNVDPSELLLEKCRAEMGDSHFYINDTVNAFLSLGSGEYDVVTAFDVLSYLTEEEEIAFYTGALKLLRPGGVLITTHSNELFDLYTFNRYTVSFFGKHFGVDVSSLLVNPEKPLRSLQNIRDNPMSHSVKLGKYGFDLMGLQYLMHHPVPPLLNPAHNPDALDQRELLDTLSVAPEDRWKLNFTCSVFCAVAKKAS